MMFFKRKRAKESKSDYELYLDGMKNDINNNSVAKSFTSHFVTIMELLNGIKLANNRMLIELYAAMVATLEFIENYYEINIEDSVPIISKWFLTPFSCLSEKEKNRASQKIRGRIEFYEDRMQSGMLRNEFSLTDNTNLSLNWPPHRISIIFCDCCYNNKCLDDYDNAPVILSGIYNKSNLQTTFAAIIQEFISYANDLKKLIHY